MTPFFIYLAHYTTSNFGRHAVG